MSDKGILAIQIAGFAAAVVFLCFSHGVIQVLFTASLGIHLTGDILRLRKDGVI